MARPILIAVAIPVRYSVGGFARAPAWPVVVVDDLLISSALLEGSDFIPLCASARTRLSDLPDSSLSERMLFDLLLRSMPCAR